MNTNKTEIDVDIKKIKSTHTPVKGYELLRNQILYKVKWSAKYRFTFIIWLILREWLIRFERDKY